MSHEYDDFPLLRVLTLAVVACVVLIGVLLILTRPQKTTVTVKCPDDASAVVYYQGEEYHCGRE